MKNKVFLSLLTGILFVLLESCTSSQLTPKQTKEEIKTTANQENLIEEYKAEMEIGRNMAGRLLQFYGNYNDENLLKYVNKVGAYVASQSDYSYRKFMFEIINSNEPNAFATPGGYIFITVGALKNIENEAELAAILAHEITHVGKRHIFETLKSMKAEELEKAAKEIDTNKNIPPAVSVRQRPKGKESEVGEAIAKYLASTSAGLNIVKAASAGMNVLLEKGLSTEKEYEADHYGVLFAINAGYNPYALRNYLCRIEMKKYNIKGPCNINKIVQVSSNRKVQPKYFEKTHPATLERINKIEALLNNIEANKIIGAEGTQRYNKNTSKLKKT